MCRTMAAKCSARSLVRGNNSKAWRRLSDPQLQEICQSNLGCLIALRVDPILILYFERERVLSHISYSHERNEHDGKGLLPLPPVITSTLGTIDTASFRCVAAPKSRRYTWNRITPPRRRFLHRAQAPGRPAASESPAGPGDAPLLADKTSRRLSCPQDIAPGIRPSYQSPSDQYCR
jgi:hypothetical protein